MDTSNVVYSPDGINVIIVDRSLYERTSLPGGFFDFKVNVTIELQASDDDWVEKLIELSNVGFEKPEKPKKWRNYHDMNQAPRSMRKRR